MSVAREEAPTEGAAMDEPPALSGIDAVFGRAAAGFQAARDMLSRLRDDIVFSDSPAPRRLAPYAAAMDAAAYRGDDEIASGRLILLYDPDGQPGWTGAFRLVTLVRADIEEEMAVDPLLGEAGWSWLTDALDLHAPGYTAPSGTVTRVITEGFGAKSDEPPRTEFELRASWCPPENTSPGTGADLGSGADLTGGIDLTSSVTAWWDLLAAAAGLPAQPPGTIALHPGALHPGTTRPGGRRQP